LATSIDTSPQVGAQVRERSAGLTVVEVQGEATAAGVAEVFREFVEDATPLVLWDLRELRLSHLTDEELRYLVRHLLLLDRARRRHGRAAFVCSRDADDRAVRMLIAHMQANDYGIRLGAFRDVYDARCWLAEV
jgi:hypothetical protein